MSSIGAVSYTDLYSSIQKGRGATDDPVTDLLLSFSNYLGKLSASSEAEKEEPTAAKTIEEKKALASQLYQQCLTLMGKAWGNDEDESKNTLDSLTFLSNTLQTYKATGDSTQLSAYLKTMSASQSASSSSVSGLFDTLG